MKTVIVGRTGTGKSFLAKKLLSDVKMPLIIFDICSELIENYIRVRNLKSLKYAIENKLNIIIDVEDDLKDFKIDELKEVVKNAALNNGYALVFDEASNGYFDSFKDLTYNTVKNFMVIRQDDFNPEQELIDADFVIDLNHSFETRKRTGTFTFLK